ncbi:MAG: hypothetical protein P4M08_09440 [Oligoflexia bacterium]|nr:hypothetical protein [Oligoflexia bacterium]
MKAFQSKHLATCLTILGLASSCSSGDPGPKNLPALPQSWIQSSSQPGGSEDKPSPEATKSVQAAFRVHSEALEAGIKPTNGALTLESQGSVPWHLDGMIASFAIDVGGVFGALVGDGDAGVKVTWQKRQAGQTSQMSAPSARKQTAYHFRSNMTTHDVKAMLEPAVRMAVATRSVNDEASLRRDLVAEGTKFLTIVRILSQVDPTPGWHIDGFQLGLFIGANGQVSPLIGTGGNIALYFDWTAPSSKPEAAPLDLNPHQTLVKENMAAFVQALSSLLPEAEAESTAIEKTGFEFQVFQVGLGIGVGGEVGIASTQDSAVGRIIFKRDAATEALLSLRMPPSSRTAIPVSIRHFREGIRRAIRMGAFFARQAAAVDTPNWKATEIELGFDTNLGGTLGLATIQGVGLIRLGFERVEN